LAISNQLSAISYQQSAISNQLSAISYQLPLSADHRVICFFLMLKADG